MDFELPTPIADYFTADKLGDTDALANCFSRTAVVRDEGQTYQGRDAIRRWKAGASRKYNYTVEPFSVAAEGGRVVVTSHVAGDFPGSPVDLRYLFVLRGEAIDGLEISL